MKRPMILCAAVSVMISFAAFYITDRVAVLLSAVALCAFFAAVLFKRTRQFAVIFAVIFANFISLSVTQYTYVLPTSDFNRTVTDLSGTVTSASIGEEYKYYIITTDEKCGDIEKGTRVKLYAKYVTLNMGEAVSVSATLTSQNTHDHRHNFSNQIFVSGYINKLYSKTHTKSLSSIIPEWRSKIRNKIFDNLPYSSAATICALTVGDRSFQEGEFSSYVKNAGVSHVMVVSGMHMAVICGSVYYLFKTLKINGRIGAVAAFCVTVLFMALCGFTASVTRAGIAYIIWLTGKFLYKSSDPLNSLSIAVVAMVIANPYIVGNIGFLLSVSSTAGIILLNPCFCRILHIDKLNKLWSGIIVTAVTTVSALIATLPITVYYFGCVSLVSVITNLLISYAVTLALVCVFAALVFSFIPPLAAVSNMLFRVTQLATDYFTGIIEYFGSLKYSTVECSFVFICCVYFLVAFLIILKYTYNKNKKTRGV